MTKLPKAKALPRKISNLIAYAIANPVVVLPCYIEAVSSAKVRNLGKLPVGAVLSLVEKQGLNASHQLQRDTVARCGSKKKTAHLRGHLEVPTAQHLIQFVAWNGALEILDGNNRLTLWLGPEPVMMPDFLEVMIHQPASQAEYDQLYRCIDSSEARKTSQDNLFGIVKACGIQPKSPLIQGYSWTSALKEVDGFTKATAERLQVAVAKWTPELIILDSYNFEKEKIKTFSNGVWASILILMREKADPKLLRMFCEALRDAREFRRFKFDTAHVAVQKFILAYEAEPSHSGQKVLTSTVSLLKGAFREFELSVLSAPRTRKARSTRSMLKLAV